MLIQIHAQNILQEQINLGGSRPELGGSRPELGGFNPPVNSNPVVLSLYCCCAVVVSLAVCINLRICETSAEINITRLQLHRLQGTKI